MSYVLSGALQAAVFQELFADPAVSELVGDAIYDVPPTGVLPDLYLLIGQERVLDASDCTGSGAWHDLTLTAVSTSSGFLAAKQVSEAVSDALNNAELALSRGRLVGIRFRKATASRAKDGHRRVDMTFRARVEDS